MKIERPGIALCIYFGIGLLVYMYGIVAGSLAVFCILAGIVAYRLIVPRQL